MADLDLLETYRSSGSEEAFAAVATRHSGMVYGVCLRILKDPAEAEDAMQATFIVLMKKIHELQRGTVLAGWLYRTARYVALHAREKAVRRAHHEREAAMAKREPKPAAASWMLIAPHLDEALGALPQAQQDVIALRYLEGLSEAEVARELGSPRGTVSTRLARGLAKLREGLRRRGFMIALPALAALLTTESAHAAPASALAGLTGAAGGTASGSAQVLAEGVLKSLFWAKVKLVVAATAAAASVIAFVCLNWVVDTRPAIPDVAVANATPAHSESADRARPRPDSVRPGAYLVVAEHVGNPEQQDRGPVKSEQATDGPPPVMVDPPTKDLVAHLPLDGDARDVSGNGNHGTAHGVVWEQDRLGHAKAACQIHGVSHIALPDAALRGLTDFTITAWLRFDTLHRTNPVPYNTFLSIVNATCPKVPGDNEILCGYGVLLGNGFAIEMHGSRPAHQAFDNSRMAEAVWCHVALRRKGEKVSLYLNGRFVSSRPTVSQPLAPAPGGAVLGQEQDRIGGGFDPNQGLDGVVDDLRIYGRALSEEEMVSFRMPMAGEEAVLTNPLDDPRLSDRTRAAMERAVQEARKHGQPVVRSAHLLLSILDGGGVAAEVLRRAGVDAGALRRRVDASVQAIKSTDDDGTPRWSCEAVDAIAFAHLERDRMDHKVLGAEHLLLGLASAPSGMAHMLLRDAGLTAEAARKQVEEIMSPEPKAMADF